MPKIFRSYFLKIFLLVIFFGILPKIVLADGLVPCGGRGEDICTLCHFIVGIDGVIKAIRNIAFVIAITAITIAGAMYVVSGGSKMMEDAKKFITATATGFVIIFAAWLMVHTTIWLFAVKGDLGTEMGPNTNWYTFTCDKTSTTTSGGQSGGTTGDSAAGGGAATGGAQCTPTNNGCGGLSSMDACKFSSQKLAESLKCLKDKGIATPTITSVTLNKSDWCEKCVTTYTNGYCEHGNNSCHFGGRNCKGQSQAVDFGVFANVEATSNFAKAIVDSNCGFEAVYYNNKDWKLGTTSTAIGHAGHVHASVNNRLCGCDNSSIR